MTNSEVEFEAFLQGLELAKSLGVMPQPIIYLLKKKRKGIRLYGVPRVLPTHLFPTTYPYKIPPSHTLAGHLSTSHFAIFYFLFPQHSSFTLPHSPTGTHTSSPSPPPFFWQGLFGNSIGKS